MIRAIARYGVRSVPGDEKEIIAAFRRGEAVEGPAIAEYESRFAEYHGVQHAIAASFGRMACYYILRALELPAGSEIIFPALTFWVIPEIARHAGLKPVFVDVDPATFNIDATKIEAAITGKTRAIVPTHLYGQPCDMTEVMRLAEKHNLVVVEDCAQAAGALYRGRKVGTFGSAALFSFQLLKGINTYGGGMALTNDDALAESIRAQAKAEPLQSTGDLIKRLTTGIVARSLVSPKGFTFWGFPIGAAASYLGNFDYSKHIWEKIRPLDRFPRTYNQRYSNVQAIVGLRSVWQSWMSSTRGRAPMRTSIRAGWRTVARCKRRACCRMSNTSTINIASTLPIPRASAAAPFAAPLISKPRTSMCAPLCRSSKNSRPSVRAQGSLSKRSSCRSIRDCENPMSSACCA